jgi:hypothetical protein
MVDTDITFDLKWEGDDLVDAVEQAAIIGVDRTLEAAVAHAKANHEWKNRTGRAEASIQNVPARRVGDEIVGQFGSYGVDYFRYLELGTSKMEAMPCLRPAEDATFHLLDDFIDDAFKITKRLIKGGGLRRPRVSGTGAFAVPAPEGRGSQFRDPFSGQFVKVD